MLECLNLVGPCNVFSLLVLDTKLMCVTEVEATLVFDLEVGGDKGRGLTPDPCREWLSSLNFVILYYLDLKRRAEMSIFTTSTAVNTHM